MALPAFLPASHPEFRRSLIAPAFVPRDNLFFAAHEFTNLLTPLFTCFPPYLFTCLLVYLFPFLLVYLFTSLPSNGAPFEVHSNLVSHFPDLPVIYGKGGTFEPLFRTRAGSNAYPHPDA